MQALNKLYLSSPDLEPAGAELETSGTPQVVPTLPRAPPKGPIKAPSCWSLQREPLPGSRAPPTGWLLPLTCSQSYQWVSAALILPHTVLLAMPGDTVDGPSGDGVLLTSDG